MMAAGMNLNIEAITCTPGFYLVDEEGRLTNPLWVNGFGAGYLSAIQSRSW